MSANALAMRLRLKRLMRDHRIRPEPCHVPLVDPTEPDMILEGFAATCDLDLDRCRLRKYAFGWPLFFPNGYPPLYLKHDTSVEVGKIDCLDYSPDGDLLIAATVTDPTAKRCDAFSIAATVNEYEMKDVDGADFYALITSAVLTEISLTDTPSNPAAKVMFRYRASPAAKMFDLLADKVKTLQKIATCLKEVTS